jgi:hypothetical protein
MLEAIKANLEFLKMAVFKSFQYLLLEKSQGISSQYRS